MKKIRLFFTAMLVLLTSAAALAQDVTVTGKVVDSSTGEPVPFASIQLKGTLSPGAARTLTGTTPFLSMMTLC